MLTVKVFDGTLCRRHYKEEAMRDLSVSQFVIPLHQPPGEMLWLPGKFAGVLARHHPQAARGGTRCWLMEVHFDLESNVYLAAGCKDFADKQGLQAGHFLTFAYDGVAVLNVKAFDNTLCRRH